MKHREYAQIKKYDYMMPMYDGDSDIPMQEDYTYFQRDLIDKEIEVSSNAHFRTTTGKLYDGNFFVSIATLIRSDNHFDNYFGYPVKVFDCENITELFAVLIYDAHLTSKEAYSIMEHFIPEHELVMHALIS